MAFYCRLNFCSRRIRANYNGLFVLIYFTTRMHSSRMRTVRCSSRLLGGLVGGLCLPGGCLPRGCVCLGVSALGGCIQHALRQTPPCGQNSWHMPVKILPCATSLRTVINHCTGTWEQRLRLLAARVAHNSCSSRILYCDTWQWRMTHVTPILSSTAPHTAFSS